MGSGVWRLTACSSFARCCRCSRRPLRDPRTRSNGWNEPPSSTSSTGPASRCLSGRSRYSSVMSRDPKVMFLWAAGGLWRSASQGRNAAFVSSFRRSQILVRWLRSFLSASGPTSIFSRASARQSCGSARFWPRAATLSRCRRNLPTRSGGCFNPSERHLVRSSTRLSLTVSSCFEMDGVARLFSSSPPESY